MEPVAPRPMGQGAGKEQEVTQHSEHEEVAPHGFLNDAPRGAHDLTVAP